MVVGGRNEVIDLADGNVFYTLAPSDAQSGGNRRGVRPEILKFPPFTRISQFQGPDPDARPLIGCKLALMID